MTSLGLGNKNLNYFIITIDKLKNIPACGYLKALKNIKTQNTLINV